MKASSCFTGILVFIIDLNVVIASQLRLNSSKPSDDYSGNINVKGTPNLISNEVAWNYLWTELRITTTACGKPYEKDSFRYNDIRKVKPCKTTDSEVLWCTVRPQILIRDAELVTEYIIEAYKNGHGWFVKDVAGYWESPYDLQKPTNTHLIEIDHVVPLYNAWISGAFNWDSETKSNFGNDVENLLAVSDISNQIKGEWGPPDYVPILYACPFAKIWINTKKRYRLHMFEMEFQALRDILVMYCGVKLPWPVNPTH
ncbi:hypothetical protein FRC03_003136 [Tulasnella sp. 419]|nr:hypothetical protein FRC03_003136 [Tulasnella sp. 419]